MTEKRMKISISPKKLKKASFWSKFMFIFLGGLMGGVFIELLLWVIGIINLKKIIFLLVGYFFLCYFVAWGNLMLPWYGAPIWIELREDGIRYQERKFWKGIYPTFFREDSINIPKGEPKFIPIENITFIGRGKDEGRAAINYKPVKKTEYLFMKDNIQIQPELVADILDWYRNNAPPGQSIEFWEVSLMKTDKQTIRGENV